MQITIVSAVWCNACLVMKKVWKEIKQIKELNITEYDYDLDEEEIKNLNVGDILPLMIFNNGKEERRLSGEKTKEEILQLIEEMVN